jgi:hypothetical protein
MAGVTKAQIKLIHILAHKNAIDDDLYRAKLNGQYGVNSSKELSYKQAIDLIKSLGGYYNPDMDRPDDVATAKQLNMIRAKWAGISTAPDDEAREKSLRRVCKKITGIDMLEWLSKDHAGKLIAALRKWHVKQAPIASGGA